jgi:amidase
MALPETVGGAGDQLAAPALGLAAAVRRREVSPLELVEASLRRIAAVDGQLGAFVTVDEEGAREQARMAEEALAVGGPTGPLHGVPIAIKDLTPTAGLRTTFGSRAFVDNVPATDAVSVARFRAAGMPIVGKTSLCEFGALPLTESLLTGPCRNPWRLSDNAGGSSGGAACAVVAAMVPFAHGTDGGGSVRIPAALCGAFGLKPSRGRISLAPNAGERLTGWSTEGPIARTVADGAALLDAMAGNELGDPYGLPEPARPFREEVDADPGRLRIGVALSPPGGGPVDPELVAATTGVADRLDGLGHHVAEASPLWEGGDPGDVLLIWSTLTAYYRPADPGLLEPRTLALARRGAETSALEYVEATVRLQQLSRRVAGFWAGYDVLLSPVTPMASVPNLDGSPPTVELIAALTSFTRWANLTGQPAAALPVHAGESRPLAVQLMGAPAGEATLLRLCGQLERALSA